MSLPVNPVDKHLPKGPNFLAVVIAFCVVIVLVLLASWIYLGRRGKKVFPVNTNATPSQTRLSAPLELNRVRMPTPVAVQDAA